MRRNVGLVFCLFTVDVQSASVPNRDEIRYTRTEAYGRTVSTLVVRPDSLILLKYLSRPRDNGDTLGSFGVNSSRSRFDSLWAFLKKGKPAEGIAPDTKVIEILGRKNGKETTFLVPVRPPIPEWARSFSNRIGELQILAERTPGSALTLRQKFDMKGTAKKDSLWLENPGTIEFVRAGKCALSVEGAILGGGAGIKWIALADTAFPQGIHLKPKERRPIGAILRGMTPGKWYYRAKWRCEPGSDAQESYREEVFSPLDSVEAGPGGASK